MTAADYYAKGRAAGEAGEAWLTACPYAGGWRREAWQRGLWDHLVARRQGVKKESTLQPAAVG